MQVAQTAAIIRRRTLAEPQFAFPRFSLAERDRRRDAVRAMLAAEGLDCLVTSSNTGHAARFQAESRYLTHCGGGDADVACVFPLHGGIAAIANDAEQWRDVQDWVVELREAGDAPGAATAQKLTEVQLRTRRIGLVGMRDYVCAPEGVVPYGFMLALHAAFPDVEWVDCTRHMQALRTVKSAEEIAFLERSTQLVDAAFARVVEVARPGVKDYDAWGAAIGVIARGGSELPVHNDWGSGIRPTTLTRPTYGELQRGHLIVNELEAAYGGYHAQGVQPIAIQDCDPAYKDLYARHAEYWERCFAALQVGRTVSEIDNLCAEIAAEVIPSGGAYTDVKGQLVMHGCGLGSDGPLVTGATRADETMALTITAGWAFVLKPSLSAQAYGRRYDVTWGDTVVMDSAGPRRLGTRAPGLAIAGI